MIGWRVGSVIEVEESVTDGVPERVADRAATLVPYGAFVQRNGFNLGGGEWRRTAVAVEDEAEGKEERESEGSEKCGED